MECFIISLKSCHLFTALRGKLEGFLLSESIPATVYKLGVGDWKSVDVE